MAYGFYCSTFAGLEAEQQRATHAFVERAEQLWGVRYVCGLAAKNAESRPLSFPFVESGAGAAALYACLRGARRAALRRQVHLQFRLRLVTMNTDFKLPAGSSVR